MRDRESQRVSGLANLAKSAGAASPQFSGGTCMWNVRPTHGVGSKWRTFSRSPRAPLAPITSNRQLTTPLATQRQHSPLPQVPPITARSFLASHLHGLSAQSGPPRSPTAPPHSLRSCSLRHRVHRWEPLARGWSHRDHRPRLQLVDALPQPRHLVRGRSVGPG